MRDPEFFQNMTAALTAEYGLTNVRGVNAIVCDPFASARSGAARAHAFSLESDEGAFVLKMHRPEKEMSVLHLEERFLAFAEARNFPLSPRMMKTQSGESRVKIEDRQCHLMRAIEGNYRTSWINPSLKAEELRAAGRALGLYHNLVSELSPEELACPAGPRGTILVHGDYHPGNLIFHRDGNRVRLTGIVDYEFGRFEDPCYDLGYALVTFASREGADGARIDTSAWLEFFNGYQSVRAKTSPSGPLHEYAKRSCGLIVDWLNERLERAQADEVERIRHAVTHFMSLAERLSKMGDVIIH